MDRLLSSGKKKQRLFKAFEWIDLIPYFIALVLLLAEVYILAQFIRLYDKPGYGTVSFLLF